MRRKTIVVIVLSLLIISMLIACGNKKGPKDPTNEGNKTPGATDSQTDKPTEDPNGGINFDDLNDKKTPNQNEETNTPSPSPSPKKTGDNQKSEEPSETKVPSFDDDDWTGLY